MNKPQKPICVNCAHWQGAFMASGYKTCGLTLIPGSSAVALSGLKTAPTFGCISFEEDPKRPHARTS